MIEAAERRVAHRALDGAGFAQTGGGDVLERGQGAAVGQPGDGHDEGAGGAVGRQIDRAAVVRAGGCEPETEGVDALHAICIEDAGSEQVQDGGGFGGPGFEFEHVDQAVVAEDRPEGGVEGEDPGGEALERRAQVPGVVTEVRRGVGGNEQGGGHGFFVAVCLAIVRSIDRRMVNRAAEHRAARRRCGCVTPQEFVMAERRLFTLRAPAFASRGKGRAHRVFHPLCGATLGTLARLALQGGVSAERAHVMAIAFAMAALRLPFTAAEAAWCGRVRGRVDYPAPVFVVGHWRSGTTHLTNVLSRSGAFATLSPIAVGLPGEALGLGRVMAPLIEQFFPRTRLIDDLALAPDLPQEDELAMANLSTLSCNHGIYFPERLEREFDRGVFGEGVGAREMARWALRLERYVAKMTRAGGGRPLLIRNPANSARIAVLRAIWPEARFIHIHRDPGAVYASSVRMFSTLVRELSLGRGEADCAALVRRVYPRLMRTLIEDSASLPPGRFVEVRYEDLCRAPMAEIARVHAALGLTLEAAGAAAMDAYLDGLRHRPAEHRFDPATAAWLSESCGSILADLGYSEGTRERAA